MAEDIGIIGGRCQVEMVPQLYEASGDGVSRLPWLKDGGEMNFLELAIWNVGKT